MILAATVCLSCLVPQVTAQTGGLSALRGQLEVNLAKSTLPTLRLYVTELGMLEKKAVAARDYEAAGAARNERLRVAAEVASQEKLALLLESRQPPDAKGGPEKIMFKNTDAKLDGVKLDALSGNLTGWSKAGACATWKLPDLAPGGYEVVLRYSSGVLEGGSLVVQEAVFSLTSDVGTTLKGFEERNIGTLKITDGAGLLKIIAKTVLKDNLMQLQAVELLPANR